jgi:putative ABC transport system ATP-binding protein
MIHLRAVSKIYRRPDGLVHALDNLDLDVAPGEFVAVRGPSGCGKTTLLTIIGGLAMPSSGEVLVAGTELTALSSAARAEFRARKLGFVFQMFHLLPYLTVLENVAAAAIQPKGARQRATELVERFGLADRLRHRPAELSVGQRQRVAIARALVNRPSLILADEPTGNLDAASAEDVLSLLAEVHREGATLVLVTHEERAAARAQRIIELGLPAAQLVNPAVV